MVTLNLTEGYNPLNKPDEDLIKFEYFTFNGGEPHIKLKSFWEPEEHILITIRIESFNDMGKLMAAVYAIDQVGDFGTVELFLPYFPGARQDRIMVKGEPLTVKMYAELINDLNTFNAVTIIDPHSDVTPALIDNCWVVDNHEFVKLALDDIRTVDHINKGSHYIVSPDAGAIKKSNALLKDLNSNYTIGYELLKCDKTRDVTTGQITGFEVPIDDLEGRDCIIVDDICDGGGTFIGLAQELEAKNCGDLILVVTHGIFSKGFKQLLGYFDKIYCTDSFNPYKHYVPIQSTIDRIKIIEAKEFL